jgi:hypothetical protein
VVSRENWEGSKSVLVADEDFDPTTTTAAAAGNREAVVVFVVVVLRVECEDVSSAAVVEAAAAAADSSPMMFLGSVAFLLFVVCGSFRSSRSTTQSSPLF